MKTIEEIKNSLKKFTGTKDVMAMPMTKAEYYELLGRPEAKIYVYEYGYFVMYELNGNLNMDGFDGYVSWLPKDVFENSYGLSENSVNGLKSENSVNGLKSESFVDRLKNEYLELLERINNLDDFLRNALIDGKEIEQERLLNIQLYAMKTYAGILKTRLDILAFKEKV